MILFLMYLDTGPGPLEIMYKRFILKVSQMYDIEDKISVYFISLYDVVPCA